MAAAVVLRLLIKKATPVAQTLHIGQLLPAKIFHPP
jgi:hypothetical protein